MHQKNKQNKLKEKSAEAKRQELEHLKIEEQKRIESNLERQMQLVTSDQLKNTLQEFQHNMTQILDNIVKEKLSNQTRTSFDASSHIFPVLNSTTNSKIEINPSAPMKPEKDKSSYFFSC